MKMVFLPNRVFLMKALHRSAFRRTALHTTALRRSTQNFAAHFFQGLRPHFRSFSLTLGVIQRGILVVFLTPRETLSCAKFWLSTPASLERPGASLAGPHPGKTPSQGRGSCPILGPQPPFQLNTPPPHQKKKLGQIACLGLVV